MNGLILRAMPVGAAMLLAACGGSGDKAAQQSEASSAMMKVQTASQAKVTGAKRA